MKYISFNNICKKFGDNVVLDKINFTIEKGTICGFIGRNGSGKTVIFKILSGILIPDSGEVLFKGTSLSPKNRFINSMGVMIETPGFIPHYSGIKNLKILNSLSINPAPLSDIKQLMIKLSLDPENKQPVKTYSLGMRQKLGIIQAIMNKPELLILDESLNSLDLQSAEIIRNLFLELNEKQGTTIILASHIPEDIDSLCNKIFKINNSSLEVLK